MGHFCFLQFDDWVWDDLEESSDHIVPEPDDDNEQTAWPSVDDSRRMFQWEQPLSLVKNPGLISQSSWGSSGVINQISDEKKEAGLGFHAGLETLSPSSAEEIWNDPKSSGPTDAPSAKHPSPLLSLFLSLDLFWLLSRDNQISMSKIVYIWKISEFLDNLLALAEITSSIVRMP
jgi:hypothetical protein